MKKKRVSIDKILLSGPVIPVMIVSLPEQAVLAAKALLAGGIRVLEITLRTPAALEALRAVAREVPEIMVGAGTVINSRQLAEISEAGAKFAVSPGLTTSLLAAAQQSAIPLLPGISTASELMTGMEYGLREFKFFPAQVSDGIKTLQAFSGPFPQARFCPGGGITAENFRDWLALKNVICVGGSWLLPDTALRQEEYQQITALAAAALASCQEKKSSR